MKKTHTTRLLEYLKVYKSITSLEAIRDLGNTRLSGYIFILKKEGYLIDTKSVQVPTRWVKPDGTKKTTSVTEYSLRD